MPDKEYAMRRAKTQHERDLIERALANGSLMEQAYASHAARKAGHLGVPGPQVQAEAEARDKERRDRERDEGG